MAVVSYATAQGARTEQQDRLIVTPVKNGQLLAVLDGHGGKQTAETVAKHLPHLIEKAFWEARGDAQLAYGVIFDTLAKKAEAEPAGSTLTAVFIPESGSRAHIAVLGDSPVAVLTPSRPIYVSPLHNARANIAERSQAIARGARYVAGYLEDPRVPGAGLQLTRALGDRELYRVLSRQPDVASVPIEKGSLILLATDGLLDSFDEVEAQMERAIGLVQAGYDAQALVEDALRRHTGDNVTAIVWHEKGARPL